MDWIPVTGESMAPFLRPGDAVAVEWIDQVSRLEPGALLLARDSSGWLLHRLIQKTCDRIYLQGDASFATDELTGEMVWGRVHHLRLHQTPPQERPFEVSFEVSALDRCIARLALYSTPPDSLQARAVRKVIRALGMVRRKLL